MVNKAMNHGSSSKLTQRSETARLSSNSFKGNPIHIWNTTRVFIFRDISENRSQNLDLPLLDSDDYWSARDYKLMWSVGFVAKVKRPEWLKLSFQLVRITCSAAYITAAFHCLLSYTEYCPQNNKNSSSYVPHLPAVNNGIQKRINKCQSPSEH